MHSLNCEAAYEFIEEEFSAERINEATLQSAADLIEEYDIDLQVGEFKDYIAKSDGLIEWNKRRNEVLTWT